MPVEVAALVRRRTLGTVQVPNVLTDAVEAAAAAGSTRSSKLQRRETQQLTDSLKQLSRTPGKGGTTMRLIDANSGGSSGKQYSKRSKKASLLVLLQFTPGKLLLCSFAPCSLCLLSCAGSLCQADPAQSAQLSASQYGLLWCGGVHPRQRH